MLQHIFLAPTHAHAHAHAHAQFAHAHDHPWVSWGAAAGGGYKTTPSKTKAVPHIILARYHRCGIRRSTYAFTQLSETRRAPHALHFSESLSCTPFGRYHGQPMDSSVEAMELSQGVEPHVHARIGVRTQRNRIIGWAKGHSTVKLQQVMPLHLHICIYSRTLYV